VGSAGGFQRRFHLGRVGVVQAETFGVGDHVREGEFGLAPLPPAVLQEVIEPYLAVAAGLVEGDHAGLQQPDQRGARDPQQVCCFLGGQGQVVRGHRHRQAGLHGRGDLEEHLEHRLGKLHAAARPGRPAAAGHRCCAALKMPT
jgi:hypothetical protein